MFQVLVTTHASLFGSEVGTHYTKLLLLCSMGGLTTDHIKRKLAGGQHGV